ncbi:MAG TPA: hypothetical protein VFK30_00680 [Anaerolineae bacterium]|nr:hypothetical protein [Anaerolineae bacterium]
MTSFGIFAIAMCYISTTEASGCKVLGPATYSSAEACKQDLPNFHPFEINPTLRVEYMCVGQTPQWEPIK